MYWEVLKLPKPAKLAADISENQGRRLRGAPSGFPVSVWLDEEHYGPNPALTSEDVLFSPSMPGQIQFRHLWYMRRWHRQYMHICRYAA